MLEMVTAANYFALCIQTSELHLGVCPTDSRFPLLYLGIEIFIGFKPVCLGFKNTPVDIDIYYEGSTFLLLMGIRDVKMYKTK